jgi:hypothetical protein
MVSRPVCLGIAPIWYLRPDFYYCQTVAGLLMWGTLSDEGTGLTFTIANGPRQRCHSRVRVPWDSRLYVTVSDLRLLFLSPPTTRRATVEVFDPASTRESPCSCEWITCPFMTRCGPETEHITERFVCCNLRIRCHGNFLSKPLPSRRSYSGFQASCHNILLYVIIIILLNFSQSDQYVCYRKSWVWDQPDTVPMFCAYLPFSLPLTETQNCRTGREFNSTKKTSKQEKHINTHSKENKTSITMLHRRIRKNYIQS